jgi:hypothetical protein
MIYFKKDKRIFSELEFNDLRNYINSLYTADYAKEKIIKLKALLRVTKYTLYKHFSEYPDIDIYLSDKQNKNTLGLFYHGIRIKKEYKRKNSDPFIVVFYNPIFYITINSKDRLNRLIYVIKHEVLHYKQWLTNDRLRHGKGLGHKIPDHNFQAIDRLI